MASERSHRRPVSDPFPAGLVANLLAYGGRPARPQSRTIIHTAALVVFAPSCYCLHYLMEPPPPAESERTPGQAWSDDFWRSADPLVLSAGYHRAEPDWVSPPRHTVFADFDIWYVGAGAGAVRLDGQWERFSPGDLLALKPGMLYQGESAKPADPFQVYYVHLLPFGQGRPRLDAALAAAWPLRQSLLHRPEARGLFQGLFEAHTIRSGTPSLAVKGLALQILQVVFEELQQTPPVEPGAPPPGVLQARLLIERDFAQCLSLAGLSAACAMSAGHLCARFRDFYGVPPIEYLLRVRIREAKLLLASGYRVKEVARQVGFSSQHYFCRVFKTRTGLTPTEFRHRHLRAWDVPPQAPAP